MTALHLVSETDRSAQAYEATTNGALQSLVNARYRDPSHAQVANGAAERLAACQDRLWAIVPMAEQHPGEHGDTAVAIEGMARHVSSRVQRGKFFVINAGSHADNIAAARQGGAIVIDQDAVFDCVHWESLLPVLHRDKRPQGRAGKGFTVLAGHIVLAALWLSSDAVVFQSDAEVANYDLYNPLERLLLVMDEDDVCHAKMAKHGRNNETTMAARAALQNLFRLPAPWIPDRVRRFAQEVFEATAADKWMLTGEWLSTGTMVINRPLSSGYGEETLQAVWSVHAPACGAANVRYVANPRARADGENAPRKEDLMMSSLASFLHALVINGEAPSSWNIDDVQRFNRDVMSQLGTVPVIGQDNGPVRIHELTPESIIPSVRDLIAARMVDLDRVRSLVASLP